MSNECDQVPDLLPVLSRGKHRNARSGACFMELVSYLAGERWSDHPACTHPLLATVARNVNDHVSDDARPQLGMLIPRVIGLTSDDLHVDARIALRAAIMALPVVAMERQRIMAVSILACERVLADLDGRPAGSLEDTSREVLDSVPDATRWARRFTGGITTSSKRFRRHAAPSIVCCAIEGIARAVVDNRDELLKQLLVEAIHDCETFAGDVAEPAGSVQAGSVQAGSVQAASVQASNWQAACELTGVRAR